MMFVSLEWAWLCEDYDIVCMFISIISQTRDETLETSGDTWHGIGENVLCEPDYFDYGDRFSDCYNYDWIFDSVTQTIIILHHQCT